MSAHVHDDGDGLRVDHHFENADQQYQSAKLGMWIFLATEILFFGGLFVAYSVYRSNHPEIFIYGHHFLDKGLGALNTVVLIFSSFTIAWAVRAAQLRQIKLLKLLLVATIACAFVFLGVKYVEYSTKWKHGLLWASKYDPHVEDHGEAPHGGEAEAHGAAEMSAETAPSEGNGGAAAATTAAGSAGTEAGAEIDSGTQETPGTPETSPAGEERSNIPVAAEGPGGLAADDGTADHDEVGDEPRKAQIFFSIYFLMTGLHGIHVIGGIVAMLWLLRCAFRGDFDGGHFTRVDMVALYWHVVDLIWIYLFLLLYLIH